MTVFMSPGGLDELYPVGDEVGKLTILEHVYVNRPHRGRKRNLERAARCLCECGTELVVSLKNLKAGTVSCGCHRRKSHFTVMRDCGLTKPRKDSP